jgi:hypothetical protein
MSDFMVYRKSERPLKLYAYTKSEICSNKSVSCVFNYRLRWKDNIKYELYRNGLLRCELYRAA